MEAQTLLIESFTNEDKVEAKKVEEQIDSATSTIISATRTLASNYARLGSLLNTVRERKFWLLGSYKSFGEYIKHVEKKYDIGHSQLYLGISIAQNLSVYYQKKLSVRLVSQKQGYSVNMQSSPEYRLFQKI